MEGQMKAERERLARKEQEVEEERKRNERFVEESRRREREVEVKRRGIRICRCFLEIIPTAPTTPLKGQYFILKKECQSGEDWDEASILFQKWKATFKRLARTSFEAGAA
ncbi:hypothetical protein BLNAU_1156 [Blattamonas nauphoetae]|uniref:Uncharacterized protein n=1 Tax=Blattamonas nauphoetae TaxID=2049346 RepID=A0ABQ9YJZ1_9EUKA|nr:hypothetical protein BLNAU_1156 [Blattamonas nauphoetae]